MLSIHTLDVNKRCFRIDQRSNYGR